MEGGGWVYPYFRPPPNNTGMTRSSTDPKLLTLNPKVALRMVTTVPCACETGSVFLQGRSLGLGCRG